MKTIILSSITALALGLLPAKAQVSSYTFSQFNGSYGGPSTGTIIGSLQQDDDVNATTLPFTFVFNGQSYNSINVCSNGYLSFNNLMGFEYSAISDMGTSQLIAPFAQDLFMGTVVRGDVTQGSNTITNVSSLIGLTVGDTINDVFMSFGSDPVVTGISGTDLIVNLNSLTTQTGMELFFRNGRLIKSISGTAPNRVCEFEYRNMTRFTVTDEVINFKVKLHETSNNIEFVYGFYSPGIFSVPCEVGLKGQNSSDFNSRNIISPTAWINSVPSTIIFDMCDFDQISYPNNGLVYLWQPSVCVTPTLSALPATASICVGQSNTITASGASNFSWSNGSASAQIIVSPTVTTSYTLTGVDGACSATLEVIQPVVAVPSLTTSFSNSLICRGNTSTISVNGASSYTWSNGQTGNKIVVSPTLSTTYTVIASNGVCKSEKTVRQSVSTCVGIDETSIENKIQTFPSPFNNELNITANVKTKISVINGIGQLIFSNELDENSTLKIDTADLPSGVYYVQTSNENGLQTKKVVKQ